MPQTRSAKAILHSVAADRADLSTPLTSASPSSDFSAAAASSTHPLPHHQQHHPPAARPLPSLLRRSTRGRAQPAESSPAPVADSFAATPASLPPSPSASATETQHALTSAASAAVVDATAGPAFVAPLPANLVLDSAPAPNPVPSPGAPALQQVSVGADVPVAAAADDGAGPSAFESSPWRRDSGPTYLRGLFDRGEEAEQTQNRDIIHDGDQYNDERATGYESQVAGYGWEEDDQTQRTRGATPSPFSRSSPVGPSRSVSSVSRAGGRHHWTDDERYLMIKFMQKSPDLQQAMLPGRRDNDSSRTINHNTLLRDCARAIHLNSDVQLEPIQVRRQIEYMNKRYEAALKELSETGKSKTAEEVPAHGFLREERAKAVRKCWFFEDWHEMRRDRRSCAPARIRLGGGAGTIAVEPNGLRVGQHDEMDDLFSEDDGPSMETPNILGETQDSNNSQGSTASARRRERDEEDLASAPAAAGAKKRRHGASSTMEALANNMRASIEAREARAAQREERQIQLQQEQYQTTQAQLEIERMNAETRRMEAETARESQRQQSELMRLLVNRLSSSSS